jgi:hypothetical protein
MSTPVPLRSDFDATQLHKLARGSRDSDQTRRLLALAEVYAGGSRSDTARIGGVGLQIVRDWVLRFNAEGPDGLLNGKAPGVPSILDDNRLAIPSGVNHRRQDVASVLASAIASTLSAIRCARSADAGAPQPRAPTHASADQAPRYLDVWGARAGEQVIRCCAIVIAAMAAFSSNGAIGQAPSQGKTWVRPIQARNHRRGGGEFHRALLALRKKSNSEALVRLRRCLLTGSEFFRAAN